MNIILSLSVLHFKAFVDQTRQSVANFVFKSLAILSDASVCMDRPTELFIYIKVSAPNF